MARVLKTGMLTGLCGLCLATGSAFAQLPPLPSDPIPVPMTDLPMTNPAFDDAPVFDPPPTLPMQQPQPLPEPVPAPHHERVSPPSYQPQPGPVYRPDPMPPAHSDVAPLQAAGSRPPGYYGDTVVPGVASPPTAWQPGGYEPRNGRPYYYTQPGRYEPLYTVHGYSPTRYGIDHSAYQYHFGPGHYRHSEGGHYRFPYYTYRAPWYFPGHPIYNRDTNRPW